MKRLTYFCLIVLFVAANFLLFVGCGCDDDDAEDKDASHQTEDTGTAGTDDGSGGTDDGSGGTDDESGGTEETGGTDAGKPVEDTGVGDDAAKDAGPEPVYLCGGDEAECDLLDEKSCDEGDGCQFLAPASGGAPFAQCVKVGDGAVGDSCDDDNLCSAGLECHGGFCHQYCCGTGEADECPTDQACVIKILDQSDESTGVLLCDDCDECNPLTMEGCSDEQGCYPINDIGCRLCLNSDGDKEAGEVCDSPNECLPGIGCYDITDDDEDVATCMAFCDFTADEDSCGDDSTCTEYEDLIGEASLDDTIGLCTPNN